MRNRLKEYSGFIFWLFIVVMILPIILEVFKFSRLAPDWGAIYTDYLIRVEIKGGSEHYFDHSQVPFYGKLIYFILVDMYSYLVGSGFLFFFGILMTVFTYYVIRKKRVIFIGVFFLIIFLVVAMALFD